jgi:polyamine oxidase
VLAPLGDGYEVHLGVVVEGVEVADDGVTIATSGTTYEADTCVVTVPLGVLKAGTIEFVPPLDDERAGAIDRLGMGLLDKVYLRFDEAFWDRDADLLGYIGPKRGYFSEWLNIAKYTGEPILLGFNASTAAEELEAMSDDEVVAEAMAALRAMYQE